MFVALARFAIRFRRQLLVFALVATPLLALLGAGVFSALKPGGFDDPNSEAFHTEQAMLGAKLPVNADLVALYTFSNGKVTDPGRSAKLLPAFHRANLDHSVIGIFDYFDTSAPELISNDGRSTFVLVSMRGSDESKIKALQRIEPILRVPGAQVKFGGISPAFQALNDTAESDLQRAELITFPITAVLLVAVFGSVVAAAVPLLLAGLSILLSFGVLRLVAQLTDVSIFAASIITVLGLGLTVDYSLFILNRYREELPALGEEAALTRAIATTGRAVAFSGVTLGASLCGLFLFPQNFLRSMAIGGIIVASVTVILALTVLPALVSLLGPRLDALRLPGLHADNALGHHDFGFWRTAALWVMRHALPVTVAVSVLLLLLASPFLRLAGSIPDVRVLPGDNQARQVSDALERDFFPHLTQPHEVLLHYNKPLQSQQQYAELYAYQQRIEAIPGVARVDSLFSVNELIHLEPGDASAFDPASQFWESPQFGTAIAFFGFGKATRLDVVSAQDIDEAQTQAQVRLLRALPPPPGTAVLVGGRAARLADLKSALRNRAPYGWLFMAAVMFVVLFLVFGSVTLPIKAMLLNLLSIGASFGALVWVFQDGRLQGLLGYHSLGTVDATQPVLMFAVVFGLSMDYEVLLLSRIREEFLRTGDNTLAVAFGLQRTGRLITSAAGLLAVVLGAFATSDLVFMKELGLGMALAIVLDATIVRALLVPATMRLLGRWNWWAPGPLAQVWQRVGFGDLEVAEAAP